MKNRTLILGLCAVVIATGSAFTTIGNPSLVTAYVMVKTSTNSNWHCIATSLDCTNSLSAPCVIQVQRDIPSQLIATKGRTEPCVALTHDNDSPRLFDPTNIVITDLADINVP